MKKTYIFLLFLVLLLPCVISTIERTATTDKICNNGICTSTLYSGVMNYLVDGVYVPIETDVQVSSDAKYDYELTTAPYSAYFEDNINTGEPVKFMKGEHYFIYDLSGGKMQWQEQEGNPTKTKSIGAILSSTANVTGNTVSYKNAFLNTDVKYYLLNTMLKEYFVLDSLPVEGEGYL